MTASSASIGSTLVAEWHEVRDGTIVRVRSAFDGRLFAPMFESANFDRGKSEAEIGAVTQSSSLEFPNYEFDFQGQDMAFVDADLTIRNVRGGDGVVQRELPVSVCI
jgi:hypothetical protein